MSTVSDFVLRNTRMSTVSSSDASLVSSLSALRNTRMSKVSENYSLVFSLIALCTGDLTALPTLVVRLIPLPSGIKQLGQMPRFPEISWPVKANRAGINSESSVPKTSSLKELFGKNNNDVKPKSTATSFSVFTPTTYEIRNVKTKEEMQGMYDALHRAYVSGNKV